MVEAVTQSNCPNCDKTLSVKVQEIPGRSIYWTGGLFCGGCGHFEELRRWKKKPHLALLLERNHFRHVR